jgi:aminopeptidase-like protein
MKNLLKNPWYLAKGPAIDVLEKEKRRINYLDIGGDFESGKWINNFLIPERWNYKQAYLLDENNKILSTTPWIHSLSVNKELNFEELQNHISFHNKNMFYNRDFGFVVKEMPKGDKFRVVINSEFGKGIVKIKQDFAFLEEWVDISQYENTKKVFIKGFLDE